MWLDDIFMWSFSQDHDCAGCVAIRLVNRTVHDLLPLKWANPHLVGMLSVHSHPPLKLMLGTPTLSPKPILCPCNDWTILRLTYHANKPGNAFLNKKKHLRDENFQETNKEG